MGSRKFVKKILKYGCDNLDCTRCPFLNKKWEPHIKEQAQAWAKQWLEEHPKPAKGYVCESQTKLNVNYFKNG
jgi:hypothetical protein